MCTYTLVHQLKVSDTHCRVDGKDTRTKAPSADDSYVKLESGAAQTAFVSIGDLTAN